MAVNNLDVAAKRLQMLKEAVPKMKGVVMLVYAAPEAPHRTRGHLHNTPLQILVERGVLGLLAWAWIFIAFFQRAAAVLAGGRRGPDRGLVMGAVRAIVGFLVGGLTEYNFGDSEVVLIAYVTLALPFGSWPRGGDPASERHGFRPDRGFGDCKAIGDACDDDGTPAMSTKGNTWRVDGSRPWRASESVVSSTAVAARSETTGRPR